MTDYTYDTLKSVVAENQDMREKLQKYGFSSLDALLEEYRWFMVKAHGLCAFCSHQYDVMDKGCVCWRCENEGMEHWKFCRGE